MRQCSSGLSIAIYINAITYENPEINLHTYDQLIFNQGAKTIQVGKGYFLQQMGFGQLDIYMQKTEVGPLPHTTLKNH